MKILLLGMNHRTAPVDERGHFRVVVTDTPQGAPGELDCRRSTKGLLMYRVVLPTEPVVPPEVTVP